MFENLHELNNGKKQNVNAYTEREKQYFASNVEKKCSMIKKKMIDIKIDEVNI